MGSIGLGTAQFAFRERSRAESIATVHAALDAGVRLIDTALAYTREGVESYAEEIVASALRSWPHESPVVATKGGHFRRGDVFPIDGSPAALRAHCEISLRTLGVDRIDLYQLHHVDPSVPFSESVGALLELRQEGKVGQIGLSNVDIGHLDLALGIAPIASVQNRLSATHASDLTMVEACAARGVVYLAYMPFGGPGGAIPPAAEAIGRAHAVSPQRVLLAWLRAQSAAILPLVGASRAGSVADSARTVELDPAELETLSALSR
jgi:aryl-alcohol dehydrogenase-like predicted oxidoreductase